MTQRRLVADKDCIVGDVILKEEPFVSSQVTIGATERKKEARVTFIIVSVLSTLAFTFSLPFDTRLLHNPCWSIVSLLPPLVEIVSVCLEQEMWFRGVLAVLEKP